MRKVRVFLILIISVLILSSCNANNGTIERDSVIFAFEETTGIFNSFYAESQSDIYINELIFASLVEIDENGKIIPSAADFEISDDNKTYTFTLKDVKFSNGDPVTSKDLEFNFKVLCDPDYYGVYDLSGFGIVGFDEYYNGDADTISGFKIIDDKSFLIELEKPNAAFLNSMTFGILSKNYYGADYVKGNASVIEELNSEPLGAGQYILSEFNEGGSATLIANEEYFKGSPNIKTLIISSAPIGEEVNKIIAGEADITLVPATDEYISAAKKVKNIKMIKYLSNNIGTIGFNCADEVLSDVNVRQAIAYATNRNDVIHNVFKDNAKVINIPETELSWAYTDDVNKYDFNIEKAREILENSGYSLNENGIFEKDGMELKITILAETPNEVTDVLLPVMKDDLNKAGIELNISNLDFNSLLDKVFNGEAQSWFLTFGITSEPSEIGSMFKSDGSFNIYGYENEILDELYEKGVESPDIEKRKPYYIEANKILNNDLPCLFLYQRDSIWLINDRIEGANATPYRSIFADFYKVKIKK